VRFIHATIFGRMKLRSQLTLLITLFLVSCEPDLERIVELSWNDEQPKLVGYYSVTESENVKVKEEKFYEDGQLEYIGGLDSEGLRHEVWKYYYPNGQLWSLGEYEHGLMEGKKEVYWPDGTMRYQGQFTQDEKSGTWIFYNVDGTILEEREFTPKASDNPKN
jgi:protein involved in sex pheromone biosynthesis